MTRLKATITLLLLFTLNVTITAQDSSVLAAGRWIKMEFNTSGVYKIDHNTLNRLGFTPAEVDPRKISIFGSTGGMLPQALSADRATDLQEMAIKVVGEEDGVFNENDHILFFVDDINKVSFNPTSKQYQVEKNLYSDVIYYFLTVKENSGKRLSVANDLGDEHPKVTWYDRLIFHELDEVNILSSGREWFGEQFNIQNTRTFSHDTPNLRANQDIKLSLSVLSQAFSLSSMDVEINSANVGTLNFNSIPNTQYGIKGNPRSGDFSISTNQVGENTLNLNLIYDQQGSNNSVAYLNRYLLNIPTELIYDNDALFIRSAESTNQAITTYEINNSPASVEVWNIGDPLNVVSQDYSQNSGLLSFGAFSSDLEQFVVFEPKDLPAPEIFSDLDNQDLRGNPPVDFIIVSHPEFINQAERLANFRKTNDQLSVLVTTTEEIYNEFSGGRQDVTAIRNLIKWQYDLGQLKYVLFFGKGSFDFKNRMPNNTNYVPTYESRNSIHPLLSYSSDDYFGFLEENEGEWVESSAGDHTLEVGIGRIPATTNAQAKRAIDKITLYQTEPRTLGDWRSKLVFIADDGDNNRHQKDADALTQLIDTTFSAYNIEKIYLDAFEQVRLPNGETSPSAERAIVDAVNEGALIINFTGHGSESGWMQEQVLTFNLMEEWNNTFTLPFVVTATCEFGRNDDPSTFSGAENLLFKDVGGAVSMVTTARPVFSSTNFDLNLALYGSILSTESGEHQRLGDIIRFTKNNSLRGSLNRNFILLGDPSMRLSYPSKTLEVLEINGVSPDENDTIRALQRVIVKGQVEDRGFVDDSFNGALNFNLLDKASNKETLGSDGEAFNYQERDSELFRGRGEVRNGLFELEFIVPKNIDYSFGNGKMTLYAMNEDSGLDALGSSIDFIIGGTADEFETDEIAPRIDLFANDTTTTIQGVYNPDVLFILKLFDQSGINISNRAVGQNISLSINDSVTYNLNDSYAANLNDFRKGVAFFQGKDLKPGLNEIVVKAWDTHGNYTSISQEILIEENSSYISVINNYPNPLLEETFFKIQHLMPGENLEVGIEIRNLKGESVTAIFEEVLRADDTIEVQWLGNNNNGNKLNPGIYIYTIKIYSKTSGKSGIKREKLVISN